MDKEPLNIYKTTLTIVIACIVLYIKFNLNYFLFVGLFLGVATLFSIKTAEIIQVIWLKLVKVLSYIMPNIVLSVFFFFFLTPLALIQRIGGKNKKMHLKKPITSTFISVGKVFNSSNLENPW